MRACGRRGRGHSRRRPGPARGRPRASNWAAGRGGRGGESIKQRQVGRMSSKAPLTSWCSSPLAQVHEIVEAHAPILHLAGGPDVAGHLLDLLLRQLLAHDGHDMLEVRELDHVWASLLGLLDGHLLVVAVQPGLEALHLLGNVRGVVHLFCLGAPEVRQEVPKRAGAPSLRRLLVKHPEHCLRACYAETAHHRPDLLDFDAAALRIEELEHLPDLRLGHRRSHAARQWRPEVPEGARGG
mmetsp:Transcript_21332/g.59176  ORF Transcript_21332/g.59176 Transcript_21332/m.59176 type:complete len:240 (+) Transcript_21332:44-763(+)